MEDLMYVDHPDQLTSLAKGWQEKQREQQHQQQHFEKITLRLSLLQPLAIPEILAPCRDPLSRYMRDQDGNRLSLTNDEYLNITALGKLWRAAWMQIPPAAVKEVCFDLSLPRRAAENGEVVHWDAGMPGEGGIAVQSWKCANLIVVLATTLKVREGGSGVRYRLVEAEDQREWMAATPVKKLSEILERLSVYRCGASRAE